MPTDAFAEAMTLLFEDAPRFARRLAARRPFATDAALLTVAGEVAHAIPEPEQVELVNAHPRLGTGAGLSAASRTEQGAADPMVDEAIGRLNDAYEARFGFRLLVFVAGRSRSELIPVMTAALERDRETELQRAIDDTLAIAADRLDRLHGEERR